jgi:hypothetical protein
MLAGSGTVAFNGWGSSSCQSLTIFNRLGPAPTNLEANDTIGRRFTTLFMTRIGKLAFITYSFCNGCRATTSATATLDAWAVLCPISWPCPLATF